jgi:glycosyltransferase involved in cell wall biosynthesis
VKVLVVTNMYPTPAQPAFGVFVQDQVESLRRLGIEVDVLFMNGRRNRLNYLAGYPRLWRQLQRERYDLVHAHYIFAGLVARAQWSCPVVLTHHGPEVFLTWEAQVCRLATRWFHSVIVVSEEMRQKLGLERAYVIPCGIDMKRFQPQPQAQCRVALGLPQDKQLVLWAGEHQRPEKRFELVAQAIDLLRVRRDDVELVLLSGRPHTLVPQYMNAADALVLASDAEGSPMVVKEAMACNLPVVATPAGDVREVIGGTEGCFVTSQDPAEIAAKLEAALAFGRRTDGRRAVAPLELGAISRRIIDVYRDTLAAHGRRDVALDPARGGWHR